MIMFSFHPWEDLQKLAHFYAFMLPIVLKLDVRVLPRSQTGLCLNRIGKSKQNFPAEADSHTTAKQHESSRWRQV